MPTRAHSLLFGFILLFGFFARAATYKAPLLDHHAWRQADTASIARNFQRDRFNILWPQVDQRGGQASGYVETGLELFAFVVAAVSVGGAFHPETGRVLAACCFLASCVCVRALVRRRHGDDASIVAAFLYAFGFPLSLFIERAFMNEALLIALSLYCLVATARYLDGRRTADLIGVLMASTLIATIKLPYLIVWAPIVGLWVERDGFRAAWRWELWVIGAVNIGAAAAWYLHAHQLGIASGLTFGLTDKLFDPQVVFSAAFPAVIVQRLARDILEPIGFASVVVGVVWMAVERRHWAELFGVLAFVSYLLLVATGNFVHDYYQLAVMPVAALVAAPGLLRIAEWLSGRGRAVSPTVVAVLLGLAASATFVRLASAHSWFEYEPRDVALCEALRSSSDAAERLVFVGDNNPMFLFCADRKGWVLSAAESDVAHVSTALEGGARLAVLYRSVGRPEVRERLANVGTLTYANDAVEVFRLR